MLSHVIPTGMDNFRLMTCSWLAGWWHVHHFQVHDMLMTSGILYPQIPILHQLRAISFFPLFRSCLHPGRLTWNLQITQLERKIIFQTSMIMFHVNLPGCKTSLRWFSGFSSCPISQTLQEYDDFDVPTPVFIKQLYLGRWFYGFCWEKLSFPEN